MRNQSGDQPQVTHWDKRVNGMVRDFLIPAVLAFAGFALFHFAFPPEHYPLGIWFSLVPFLALAKRGLKASWPWLLLASLAIAQDLHHWLFVFHPLAPAFYLIYCGLIGMFLPLAVFALLSRFSILGAALAFPGLWTLIEWIRTEHLFRFGFGGLAYSQAFTLLPIQITDLTGVYGLVWLIAAVNVAIWIAMEAISSFLAHHGKAQHHSPDTSTLVLAGVTASVLAGALMYGHLRLSTPLSDAGLRVGLAQYDHPSNAAYFVNEETWLAEYERLARFDSADRIDMVILPENAILRALSLDPSWQPEGSTEVLNRLSNMARGAGRSVLIGALEAEKADPKPRLYNGALLFDAKGDLRGRYRKSILAPFGEADPLGGLWPAFDRFVLELTDAIRLDSGEGSRLLRTWDSGGVAHAFGLLVCYEATSGDYARRYSGLGAEFLVNITSDRWTSDPGAMRQHAAFSVFRAVENRKSLFRVGNGGLSCAIDPLGRVITELPLFTYGTISWEPSLMEGGPTLYARASDWILVFAGLVTLGGAAPVLIRKRVRGKVHPVSGEDKRHV